MATKYRLDVFLDLSATSRLSSLSEALHPQRIPSELSKEELKQDEKKLDNDAPSKKVSNKCEEFSVKVRWELEDMTKMSTFSAEYILVEIE
ncbi:hypothetical protein TNCV_1735671 [Trichonephila clavipes]|nr:hypothetical protein TNCV_1735671 [Trichonephila clavipes]